MTSRLLKALLLGLLVALAGLILGLLPFGPALEESIGLDLLFSLRGERKAPSDVVVVSIDRASAENLDLPENPETWPRTLHARLVENLSGSGAVVVVFDVFFKEAHSTEEDDMFGKTIDKAGNVVLCEYLKRDTVPVTEGRGTFTGQIHMVKPQMPTAPLAQSALALAPFPLPKVPVKVSRYWAFRTDNTPTLPIVAFQVFAMDTYDDFFRLLEKVSPVKAQRLPQDRETLIATKSIEKSIREIRDIFECDNEVPKHMLSLLHDRGTFQVDARKAQILESLIKMYQNPGYQYLNFYGPSGTVSTISYYKALRPRNKSDPEETTINEGGKAVFVGLSERFQPEQRDGFHTVFSESSGVDISGVEIAATAFANLLEDMPVRPLSLPLYIMMVFFWGLGIGMFCRLSPTVTSIAGAAGLSILYLITIEYSFKTTAVWYPLVIPLFFQTPLSMFSAVLWKYIDANRERQNIKKAFGYYLPAEVVDRLSKNIKGLETSNQVLYGTCLYTDAEHYTSLSEAIAPNELGGFMNRYYEFVFEPVRRHAGTVANVIGDAMLAIWVSTQPDASVKDQACLAALDIAAAVNQFNQTSSSLQLPTRIGLHSGRILLGNIGAVNHYEYRPVGDIVNTATRVEGLNKFLGTRILLSEESLCQLDGFLTREMGTFLLLGKSRPVVVHELLCRREGAEERQVTLCAMFASALDAFRRKSWKEAVERFHDCLIISGGDGPSEVYVRLCEEYKRNPPAELWDGVIRMEQK